MVVDWNCTKLKVVRIELEVNVVSEHENLFCGTLPITVVIRDYRLDISELQEN